MHHICLEKVVRDGQGERERGKEGGTEGGEWVRGRERKGFLTIMFGLVTPQDIICKNSNWISIHVAIITGRTELHVNPIHPMGK